ncbi:CheR family methyltransferase [Massilia sp.]|uniref:CheR family methyltransferase n=1 Tax=Massilia sp. TaxID=1882437 RepID=UPI0028AED9D6|nr:CheR family methyltransferase [Massilia sp.]
MAALNAFAGVRAACATDPAVEELEIALLLEALFQRHGYDFRDYDRHQVRRKLLAVVRERALNTVSALQERVLHEPGAASHLLRALAVAPATLFDSPECAGQARIALGASLRPAAVPKVWLAECASVGEAWSLAILLAEEDLLARTEIFATLANDELLAEVREASIDAAELPGLQQNYERSGGSGRLSDYFELRDGRARLLPRLRARITWAQYNLVTDASFNEFQAIVCRRALADFGPVLRQRVLRLFHDSLARFGVLGIDRELAPGDAHAADYLPIFGHLAWYKRVG